MWKVDFHSVWTLSAGMASTNFCRLWPAKMDFRLSAPVAYAFVANKFAIPAGSFASDAIAFDAEYNLLCSERRMPSATLCHTPFQSTFLNSRFSKLLFLNKFKNPLLSQSLQNTQKSRCTS